MSRTCFVFNQAPRYVESSYVLFDKELDIKWCFGSVDGDIKEMDHSLLKDVTVYQTKRGVKGAYRLEGVSEVAKDKSISAYVLIGDPQLLDTWMLPLQIKLYNRKAKICYWSHGWYGKESKLRALIKKVYFRLADGVLLYGNYARELMIKEGFKPDTLYTIHNSLHHDQQVSLRNTIEPSIIYKEHFGNNNPTIIFIGRLTKVKQLDMVINALSILKDKGEYYNLVFVGDGTEREVLESLVRDKNLNHNVWFYGACYDEKQNAELIYNADLCVSPGNVGLTAMHALVFGCPVITHDNFSWQMPEFESIHPFHTGNFFKQGDMDSLVEKISEWFRVNGSLRDIIRKKCYDEIDNYWTPEFELSVLKKALKIE